MIDELWGSVGGKQWGIVREKKRVGDVSREGSRGKRHIKVGSSVRERL
jgi:hypothetical protein